MVIIVFLVAFWIKTTDSGYITKPQNRLNNLKAVLMNFDQYHQLSFNKCLFQIQ